METHSSHAPPVLAQQNPLSFNPLLLLRNQQLFLSKIIQLNDKAAYLVNSQKHNDAIQYLNKALDMISLSRSASREITPLLAICLNYNIAAAYEGSWILENCHTYCELAIGQLNNYIKSLKDSQQNIKYSLFIFKLRLQFCAILSQLGKHDKALELSHQNKREYVKTLQQISDQVKRSLQEENRYSASFVSFSKQIERSLQTLHNLIESIDNPKGEVLNKTILYNWKSNPQNNQKQIKKHFGDSPIDKQRFGRSFLGVTQEDWLYGFNIGSIMHIYPMTYQSFTEMAFINEEIAGKKLEQKVLLASILEFTISTEMRLMQTQAQTTTTTKPKKHAKPIKTKYSAQAQSHHLKAISLVCQNIPISFPYLNHLISTFHKHYLQELRQIQEKDQSYINQISLSSKLPEGIGSMHSLADDCPVPYLIPQKRDLQLKVSGCQTQPVADTDKNEKSTKPHSKPKQKNSGKLSKVKSEEKLYGVTKRKSQSRLKKQCKKLRKQNKSKAKLKSQCRKSPSSTSRGKGNSRSLNRSGSTGNMRLSPFTPSF